MNKKLLYILLLFSSAVIADWTTIEHDFNMCDQVVPSNYAAIHVNDDGHTYSTSLLVRGIETLEDKPNDEATYNITMWGCTYDCNFSFVVKLNRVYGSVSVLTDNKVQNYVCGASDYKQNLIPTPKVTYTGPTPDENHVFPPDLTAVYCSKGIHPDAPDWPIEASDNVHTCIDRLIGREDGTYAASLQFGIGSTFPVDKLLEAVGVATYHMVDSANKAFDHWERHHRGFHDVLDDLSIKMTPDNLKELAPPPPPEPKFNLLTNVIVPAIGLIIMCAIPIVGEYAAGAGAALLFGEVATEISEAAAEIAEAEEIIASTAEGSVARNAAVGYSDFLATSRAADSADKIYKDFLDAKRIGTLCSGPNPIKCSDSTLRIIGETYRKSGEPKIGQILAALNRGVRGKKKKRGVRGKHERREDTVEDNVGFFTANLVGAFFLPNVLSNVHDSLSTDGKSYPHLSSYLAGASENLLFHFNDTVYNNMFAANKSILTSFVKSQGVSYDQLLGSDDELYTNVRNRTYNHMSASIISTSLQKYNVVICDPKPSFCGQPCKSGHIFCPTIGTDNCVITAAPGQISELQSLRDTSDICSTDKGTGWKIDHNSNCDISFFKCQ